MTEIRTRPPEAVVIGRDVLAALPDALRGGQRVFDATGGLHAAGLFDESGDLLVLREDIGRHNAVDKVVGARVLAGAATGAPVLLRERPHRLRDRPEGRGRRASACSPPSAPRRRWRSGWPTRPGSGWSASCRPSASSSTPEPTASACEPGTVGGRLLRSDVCASSTPPTGTWDARSTASGCSTPRRRSSTTWSRPCRREAVDLVLVSGDVYDRALPPVDAVELAGDALARLAATGVRTVVTSGNHDSAIRLGVQRPARRRTPASTCAPAGRTSARPVVVEDRHGEVAVHGIPYLEPDAVRQPWAAARPHPRGGPRRRDAPGPRRPRRAAAAGRW